MELLFQAFSETVNQLGTAWQTFSYVWYVVLPIVLFPIFKFFWLNHIQGQYWSAMKWMLLEIIPPKDIEKSPKPMESFFAGLAGVEKGFNPVEEYVQGMFTDFFSLELVSDGGSVHFYIRTQRKYRSLVEAHLYAQYPDIQVFEVPDYVYDVPKIVPNAQWDIWGTDLEFTKDDAYPIKTYNNFVEDVTGKMIDPLAGLVEIMGKLPPGQKLWYQLVISPLSPKWGSQEGAKLAQKLKGKDVKSETTLEQVIRDFKDVFSNLYAATQKDVTFPAPTKKEEQPLEFRLSPGERDVLKAVEDNLGKIMFKVKARFVIIGRKEGFDKSFVSGFMGGMKQFGDENLNGFRPNNDTKTFANYIFTKPRLRYRQRKILRYFRNRSNDGVRVVLSTSELATLFHVPDMQVAAPSILRVDAKRGGAPTNLPVG